MENKINAGLYIRVSTEQQVKEGYSIDAQKHNLVEFAKRQDWNIYGTYADEGISGKNIADRPEVNRLINDITNNRIDVVLLYKFDRLTRSMSDTEDIIELVQKHGIQVFTISGGVVDVSTATGRFTTRISGAVAQLEREQTVERIKVAFEQKVRDGYTLACATTSYGYNRPKGEKIQIINELESKIVKKIFKMYNEDKTFSEIAHTLNTLKIPTKLSGRVRSKRLTNGKEKEQLKSVWQPKTIRLILSNPTYIGKVRYGINTDKYFTVDGKHEPIIDVNSWNKVQEKISKIPKVMRTNHTKEDRYFLGTLRCGICGAILTTNRTGGRLKKDGTRAIFHGYRCLNREKGICTAIGMSHPKVEKAFSKYIEKIEDFTEIDKLNIKDKNDEILEEIELLKKENKQIRIKKQEVMKLFMLDKIMHEELTYMLDELDSNSKSIIEELNALEKKRLSKKEFNKNSIAKSMKEHWQYLSKKEKKNFLNNFVKEMVVINKSKDRHNGIIEIINLEFYE